MPGSETKKARDRERMKRIRAESGWRLIDTAPKDGTVIDVWSEFPQFGYGCRFPDVFWKWEKWCWEFEGMWPSASDSGGVVTHWMPSPPPPKPST